MTPLVKEILHTFDEYVFGFMRSDIHAAIKGNANYLAALGLVSYTEVLGGLRTGYLGQIGHSKDNFNAFLPYLGNEYKSFRTKGIDVYDQVRCGLVHNYFVKGTDSSIWMQASAPCGIIANPNGPTLVIVNVYAEHLFAGAARYRDEILEGSDPTLSQYFADAMRNIGRPLQTAP